MNRTESGSRADPAEVLVELSEQWVNNCFRTMFFCIEFQRSTEAELQRWLSLMQSVPPLWMPALAAGKRQGFAAIDPFLPWVPPNVDVQEDEAALVDSPEPPRTVDAVTADPVASAATPAAASDIEASPPARTRKRRAAAPAPVASATGDDQPSAPKRRRSTTPKTAAKPASRRRKAADDAGEAG